MNRIHPLLCRGGAIVIAAAVGILAGGRGEADAQQPPPLTARRALDMVAFHYGSGLVAKVVELRGEGGQPQPSEWWMTVHDPKSPTSLRLMWAGEREVTNEGPDDESYPHQPPRGFFSIASVKLDSSDAFRRADELANAAQVGFDRLDYVLRAREFSSEPVWEVRLLDRSRRIAGWIVFSAVDGRVYRTVWYRRGRGWEPKVEDSALFEGGSSEGSVTVEPGRVRDGNEGAVPPPPVGPADPAGPPVSVPPPPPGSVPPPPDPGNEAGEVVPIPPPPQ